MKASTVRCSGIPTGLRLGGQLADVIFSDWTQVKSVVSATVNLVNPLRMQFPNARAWATTGGTCSASNPCGLGAISIVPSALMSGYIVKDLTLLVPKIFNTNAALGISATLTRGVQIIDHTCTNASQNCVFNYLTQGGTIAYNNFNTQIANEQASDVDYSVIGNHVNTAASSLMGLTASPTNPC